MSDSYPVPMDVLHAPWRIPYILGPKREPAGGSIFSRIANSNDDEANHVIARSRTCFAFLNTFPYTGGHTLVAPYRQVADLDEMNDTELQDLMRLVCRCQAAIRRTMRPNGFNIGLNIGREAGAGITDHLHIHIVPRWLGDTNFMPVLGAATVLPEALTETAAQLRAALADS